MVCAHIKLSGRNRGERCMKYSGNRIFPYCIAHFPRYRETCRLWLNNPGIHEEIDRIELMGGAPRAPDTLAQGDVRNFESFSNRFPPDPRLSGLRMISPTPPSATEVLTFIDALRSMRQEHDRRSVSGLAGFRFEEPVFYSQPFELPPLASPFLFNQPKTRHAQSTHVRDALVNISPMCAICLEDTVCDDKSMATMCGHVFHVECISHVDKCPTCRERL